MSDTAACADKLSGVYTNFGVVYTLQSVLYQRYYKEKCRVQTVLQDIVCKGR